MSARTPLLTPKPIAYALGLLLSCLASQSQASYYSYYLTDPSQRAFDISDLTVSSSGVGITTLSSQIDTYYGHSVTSQSPVFMGTVRSYSEVVLKPTATSTGLAYDYNVNRYTGRETSASWNTSNATINVTSDAAQSAGDKYILVTGKLTAKDDLGVGNFTAANEISLGYYATSNGNFLTNNSIVPGVSGIQGSASFYFGANAGLELPALISASSSTTYNAIDKTYVATTNPITNSAVTNGFLLKGGETTSFSALVYASDGASLKDFSIKLNSSTFNFGWGEYDVGQSYTQSDYVGQHILAAVPEPENYALFLGGLGLIGFMVRRSRNEQA